MGWALADVEVASDGEFKASAVGAYERGERSISAVRLARLAELYGISSGAVLDAIPPENFVIDLTEFEKASVVDPKVLDRALAVIRSFRRTPGSRDVRRSDLRVLSALATAVVEPPEAPGGSVFIESL